MKWVKVSDKLPTPLTDILVYGECICGHKGCNNVGKVQVWCAYKQRMDDEFLTLENTCAIKAEYWMELPEPPKIAKMNPDGYPHLTIDDINKLDNATKVDYKKEER